jgi:phosphate transport system substrate-binding protein
MFKLKNSAKITKVLYAVILLSFLYSLTYCKARKVETITIKGSDTMVILGQRWAEHYMEKRKDVVIQTTGGGSGTGIAALIQGATEICQSSRPMKEKEKEMVFMKRQKSVVEIPVAVDGIAIYVHKANPVEELTLSQLKDIYTGKITNWKDFQRTCAWE